jgi:hypothetical protein
MIRRFAYAAVVLVALAPRPALADPIKFPDPFVGVRGEEGSIRDDDGFHTLGTAGCADISAELGVSAFCQTFDIFSDVFPKYGGRSIQSMTLAFTELGGFGLESQFLSPDTSGFNELGGAFEVEDDGFSVTLFFQEQNTPPPSNFSLRRTSFFYPPPGIACNTGNGRRKPFCTIQIYLYPGQGEDDRDPYAVSIRAINGVTTDTTPIPAPVPEPGTLLLMGTGIAGLAARRMRRRSS